MPNKKKSILKRKSRLARKNLSRRFIEGEGLPEFEVEVKTTSANLANRLVGIAQNSKKASEIDLDIDLI